MGLFVELTVELTHYDTFRVENVGINLVKTVGCT